MPLKHSSRKVVTPNPETFHLERVTGLKSRVTPNTYDTKFEALPKPTGKSPYHLSLTSVLSSEQIREIESSSKIIFHTVGDTGNYNSGAQEQRNVIDAMGADFNSNEKPHFFYHLGDVVYFTGQASEYYPQFYEPYISYPAPIVSIPGNHDGARGTGDPASLKAYVNNFCAKTAHKTIDALEAPRKAMTQPNVYWTLEAPLVRIIGLYSNVPPGGEIKSDQLSWFVNELRTAPKDKALIVCVHHPLYSLDIFHAGSTKIEEVFDSAYSKANRRADMVLTGHVHDFQRYTEVVDGMEVPHIVAGAGGHSPLHKMQKQSDGSPLPFGYKLQDADDVTLENYCDNRHGFMKIQVTASQIIGDYYATNIENQPWDGQVHHVDSFEIDYKQHKLIKNTVIPIT